MVPCHMARVIVPHSAWVNNRQVDVNIHTESVTHVTYKLNTLLRYSHAWCWVW